MKLETEWDQCMAIAAFRYCLGRSSYFVEVCTDWVKQHWAALDERNRKCIERELDQYLNDAVSESRLCDMPWAELRRWIKSQP